MAQQSENCYSCCADDLGGKYDDVSPLLRHQEELFRWGKTVVSGHLENLEQTNHFVDLKSNSVLLYNNGHNF